MSAKRIGPHLLLLLLLFLAGGLALYALAKWYASPFNKAPFDAAAWRGGMAAGLDTSCVRGAMVQDLMQGLADGTPRQEVVALLGQPNGGSPTTVRYYLGFCSGNMVDYDELILEFDGRGRLSGHTLFIPKRTD